jgi:hypothetical protein
LIDKLKGRDDFADLSTYRGGMYRVGQKSVHWIQVAWECCEHDNASSGTMNARLTM